MFETFNPKGPKVPAEYGYGLYSFNFHQNFSNFFLVKAVCCQLSPNDRNRPQGALKEVIHFSDVAS